MSKIHKNQQHFHTRAVLAIAVLTPTAWAAQVSPLGHTGAVNTPTAEVLPLGAAALSIANSIPEWRQQYRGQGAFGGLTAGVGPVPGLELFGRLTYDGDLQCNMYDPSCKARARDLSLNGKYQLPMQLPLNTRLAIGLTDYGGAATNFRQTYAVATSQLGPLDVSLGRSKGGSPSALMHGTFGSAELHMTPQWAVSVENDTRTKRLGTHYAVPVSRNLDVQVGLSKRLSGSVDQRSTQMMASLLYVPDSGRPGNKRHAPKVLWGGDQADGGLAANPWDNVPDAFGTDEAVSDGLRASKLASLLEASGFEQVSVKLYPESGESPRLWAVNAEPSGWRQNATDALRVALPHWASTTKLDTDELLITLTYLQEPKLSAVVSRGCIAGLGAAQLSCAGRQPLRFFWGGTLSKDLTDRLAQGNGTELVRKDSSGYKPRVELGVDIRSTVGTEYGLVDYALGLDVGGELPLGKGWSLQGNAVIPVAASDDFRKRGIFHTQSQDRTELRQGLLSYWRNIDLGQPGTMAVQVSAGAIKSSSTGGQVDAVWLNPTGDWRVGGTMGAYRQRINWLPDKTRVPALLSVHHTLMPGYWQMEGIAGQFFGGDRGFRINSHHWFGAQRLTLFYRSSGGQEASMPNRKFAGFELSFPLGGRQVTDLGWASVRGRDRMAWGLSTKVGDSNNNLTTGYGEIPRPRHGVWTDVLDHDRAGAADASKSFVSSP